MNHTCQATPSVAVKTVAKRIQRDFAIQQEYILYVVYIHMYEHISRRISSIKLATIIAYVDVTQVLTLLLPYHMQC